MDNIPSFSQSANHLQNENTTSNTPTTNLTPLLLTNTSIIIHSKELSLNTRSPSLLCRHTKVQHITRVVHGKNKDTLLIVHTVHDTFPDLLRRRRGEDGTCHGGIEETIAHETSEGGFMAGTTARDDGDLGVGGGVRTTVYDFVFGVEGERGVGEGEGVEGGLDEVRRVVDEVFC